MSLFLHQTTTRRNMFSLPFRCICLFSYIKPQLSISSMYDFQVVYVSFPTSNHNIIKVLVILRPLYMSLFLHQTTTLLMFLFVSSRLYMSLFLHQTTTWTAPPVPGTCCICLFSYIKPQLMIFLNMNVICCICLFSYIKPQRFLLV